MPRGGGGEGHLSHCWALIVCNFSRWGPLKSKRLDPRFGLWSYFLREILYAPLKVLNTPNWCTLMSGLITLGGCVHHFRWISHLLNDQLYKPRIGLIIIWVSPWRKKNLFWQHGWMGRIDVCDLWCNLTLYNWGFFWYKHHWVVPLISNPNSRQKGIPRTFHMYKNLISDQLVPLN